MTEYNYTKEEYMSLRKAFLRYHYRGEYNYADFLFPESIPVFLKIADKERNIDEGKVVQAYMDKSKDSKVVQMPTGDK